MYKFIVLSFAALLLSSCVATTALEDKANGTSLTPAQILAGIQGDIAIAKCVAAELNTNPASGSVTADVAQAEAYAKCVAPGLTP